MKIININGHEKECVKAYPDKAYPGYMRVEFKTEVRDHYEWYPIAEFIKNNPNLVYLTKGSPIVTAETLGIVSKATESSLTDKKRVWEVNSYINFPIWISRGKGETQVRIVVSNTKNTIKIDKPWDIVPDKTSQYVISYNIHNPQPLGNTLPSTDKFTKN